MLVAKHGLKQILEDPNSKKIFYFLCINLVSELVNSGKWDLSKDVSLKFLAHLLLELCIKEWRDVPVKHDFRGQFNFFGGA